MRISDWSSDVCSSDLRIDPLRRPGRGLGRHAQDHPLRPAAQTQPRRDGEGRGRTGRRAEAEGPPVGISTRRGPQILTTTILELPMAGQDPTRKSVVKGKSVSVRVDIGGRRIIKKKQEKDNIISQQKK